MTRKGIAKDYMEEQRIVAPDSNVIQEHPLPDLKRPSGGFVPQ
jgi:hypothetical protein